MLQLGDVILFTDYINETEKKTRPLVVLKTLDNSTSIVGVRCTTKSRSYDDYSYDVDDWESCGLKAPSSIRCDKLAFLRATEIYKDNNGNPKVVAQLTPKSTKEVVKRFELYQKFLESMSCEMNELTKEQTAYAIRVVEAIGNDTFVQFKIYDDKETAKTRYDMCYPEFSKTVIDGKLVDVNTGYQLGTIKIRNNLDVDEQSFELIAATNNLAQTNSIAANKR